MIDLFLKIFGKLLAIFYPEKLIEWQIRIVRLVFTDSTGVEDFENLYEEAFPNDGRNYTARELIESVANPNNDKKHVKADNIFLLSKYNGKAVGFITCFYYPEKKYGIIGYLGRTKSAHEVGSYASIKLMNKLKSILLKEHDCKMLVFELEIEHRDSAKAILFKSYAKKLNLNTFELEFDYWRPKIDLEDKNEEKLRLLIVPIKKTIGHTMNKSEVMEILNFLHFYCYGDYYDISDPNFETFQDYLKQRMEVYEQLLPDTIEVK